MLFNHNPTKQAIAVCFSLKRNNVSHQLLISNNNKMQSAPSHRHLGLALDSKLDLNQLRDDKANICNKIIKIMKRISMNLSRKRLLIIYTSFVSPLRRYHIYVKPVNESFKRKLEAVQYNASLNFTGATKGTLSWAWSRVLE